MRMRQGTTLIASFVALIMVLVATAAPSQARPLFPNPAYAVGFDARDLVVDDFNGDGAVDAIVAAGAEAVLLVFLGRGDGTLGDPQALPVGGTPGDLVAADFNADGRTDLAVATPGGSR